MKYFVLVLTMLISTYTNAERFMTANDLLTACEAQKDSDLYEKNNDLCKGYVTGVIDWHGDHSAMSCLNKNMTDDQVVKVFIKYANDNPGLLNMSASSTVVQSYVKAFNCRKIKR